MRVQIWASLCDFKFKAYLISILVNKYQKWDRNINIFIAFAASSSIASWAIWQKYDLVWSLIIVASQVINVIKPYIPYFKFVKELNLRSQKLDILTIEYEQLWYQFNNRKISEDEAAKMYFDLKKRISELLNFGDDILFHTSKRNEKKANEKMKNYLKTNYNIKIDTDYE